MSYLLWYTQGYNWWILTFNNGISFSNLLRYDFVYCNYTNEINGKCIRIEGVKGDCLLCQEVVWLLERPALLLFNKKKLLLYSANFIWENDFSMEIHLWIWIALWTLISKWRLLGSHVQHCKSVHFIHGYNIHHISLHLFVGHFRNVFFKPLDPI